MDEYATLNHTTWDCEFHVVFIPKYRRKILYQELRRPLGEVFRQLAAQKEAKVEEGHLLVDHVHMLLTIPPKYAVSNVVGHQMSFQNFRLALLLQPLEHLAQMRTQARVNRLAPTLGNENEMIFAVPCRVA